MGGWDDEAAFLDQLVYLNRRVLEAVDAIDEASATTPIVVIQGDHGTARTDTTHRGGQHGPDPEERMPILNAVRVPDAVRPLLRHEATPVNTFRVILSTVLETDLAPLPDRVFYSWYAEPYEPHDVTARLGLVRAP